jgi:hypothetical protein
MDCVTQHALCSPTRHRLGVITCDIVHQISLVERRQTALQLRVLNLEVTKSSFITFFGIICGLRTV